MTASYHYSGGVEPWRDLVSKYFSNVERALCVMDWESGGNPNAISPTQDYGLMQIHAPMVSVLSQLAWLNPLPL